MYSLSTNIIKLFVIKITKVCLDQYLKDKMYTDAHIL